MTRGLILAAGSAALVLVGLWLSQQHLTMSPGMVVFTLVIAGAIGGVVGWMLRLLAEGDRLTSLEHKWKDRLAAFQSELGHMTSRANTLVADARAKDDQIIDRDRTIANLTIEASKIEALHGILRDKDRLINDLDERISALTLALDDRTTALGQREGDLAHAAERHAVLEQEIGSLRAGLGNMVPKSQVESITARHIETQSSNSDEVAKLKRQLATRDQSLKDAAAKIATLETKAAELATVRAKLAEAEATASDVAHRIEELEREVAARVPEADYHEAKTQIAELRGATSKLADVEIQLLSTGEQASELSQRVHELEERLREMVPRSEYEALNANLRALTSGDDHPQDSAGAR
jgi:DNA repair exonuclease SbcCD ATPase subunit